MHAARRRLPRVLDQRQSESAACPVPFGRKPRIRGVRSAFSTAMRRSTPGLSRAEVVGAAPLGGGALSVNANYTLSRCRGLEMPPNAQSGIGSRTPQTRMPIAATATPIGRTSRMDGRRSRRHTSARRLSACWRRTGGCRDRQRPVGKLDDGDERPRQCFNGQANQRVDQVSSDVYGAEDTGELI